MFKAKFTIINTAKSTYKQFLKVFGAEFEQVFIYGFVNGYSHGYRYDFNRTKISECMVEPDEVLLAMLYKDIYVVKDETKLMDKLKSIYQYGYTQGSLTFRDNK